MGTRVLRFIDTGVRTAAENMALDELLLHLRGKNQIPDTIRLLQFNPPAVLIGFHQAVEQEVRIEYCKRMGIDINRRITGGGAIYFDQSQLGWEIIGDKKNFGCEFPNSSFYERLSRPIINMLRKLGINARFRGRNDIEVSGRKISGTGGAEYNNAFLFQGTLLINFDVDNMLRALRIPIEKLKKHEIDSLKERVTCIKWELGFTPQRERLKDLIKESFEETFGIRLYESGLTEIEEGLIREYTGRFESEKWINKVRIPVGSQPIIYTTYVSERGKIKAFFTVNLYNHRIQNALFIGDFFVYPSRVIFDIESALKETPLEKEAVVERIEECFNKQKNIIGVEKRDFFKIIDGLFERLKMIKLGISPEESNHIFCVNGTYEQILNRKPSHLLLPYCAKSTECEYRYKDSCLVCNKCSVGEAYGLAKKMNIKPITIISFEDLVEKLASLKRNNIKAYIGCCCEQFYTKHRNTFESIGIPGILLDINSETCYDLGKASFAYRGEFENQTRLNLELLKRVLNGL